MLDTLQGKRAFTRASWTADQHQFAVRLLPQMIDQTWAGQQRGVNSRWGDLGSQQKTWISRTIPMLLWVRCSRELIRYSMQALGCQMFTFAQIDTAQQAALATISIPVPARCPLLTTSCIA